MIPSVVRPSAPAARVAYRPRQRTTKTLLRRVAFALLCLCLLAPAGHAQDTVTGAFEGTVTDSNTGKLVVGATALIINQQTGQTYTKTSDARGRFYQGLLAPGIYTIRVSAPGYQTKEVQQRLFITRAGEVVPVPVGLEPLPAPTPVPTGAPSPTPPPQTLTASDTDTRARANATDARQGGAFTEEEVSTLPLGESTIVRTFDELALLLPGVAPPPQTLGSVAGPGVGAGVGSAGQFAVNGLRSRANNFTVDGSDNNDEDIGVRRQGFVALNSQPIESVKEYQAITLLAPAQFGRNIGAQVNAVSKSGGAGTHGAAYGLLNSSRLNARNTFDTAFGNATTPLTVGSQNVVRDSTFRTDLSLGITRIRYLPVNPTPLTVRNESGGEDSFTFWQGGFVLGGPLEEARGPDSPPRMFYFIAAEGYVTNAVKEESFAVPTVAQRGLFGTGASSNFSLTNFSGTASNRFTFPASASGNAIFSLFPFPNNPQGVYGANTFTETLPASAQGKVASGRFDRNFTLGGNRQSFTARYNFTQDWRDIPATGGALFSTLRPRVRTQNLSLFLNGEAPRRRLFNQVRLSYGRTRLNFEDVRDREFLLPSAFSDPTFGSFGLLNAPLLDNLTSPSVNASRAFVANTGDVFYLANTSATAGSPCSAAAAAGQTPRVCTTEDRLGPVGEVNVAGFSPVGIDVFNFPQRRVNNTYQLADTLTRLAGDHRFTFGADTRRTELNSELPRNARTLLTFNGVLPSTARLPLTSGQSSVVNTTTGLFSLPTDRPIRPEDLVAVGAASGDYLTLGAPGAAGINLRFYQLNFFAQDEWRVRPRLTLSYGLRYEYNTPPREAARRIEDTFASPQLDLVPGLRNFIAGRTRIFDPDRNNFAPRVSVAYAADLFGRPDAPTVIRAGYGLFYDQILGAVVSQSRNVFPTFLTANLAGGIGNFAYGDAAGTLSICNPVATALSGPCSNFALVARDTINTPNPQLTLAQEIAFINCFARGGGPACTGRPTELLPNVNGAGATLPARRLLMPMAQHYSFAVEQQLGSDLALSVAYVGTSGRDLLRFTTPNLGPNTYLTLQALTANSTRPFPAFFGFALPPGARVTAAGTLAGGRPNNGVGSVNIFESTARSRYDALQVQARGRLARVVQYQVGYTLAKATDDVSDVFDLAGAAALPQDSFNLAAERAPANFDVRHRLAYNFVYDLPAFRGRAYRALLGGFQLASLGSFQTGQPFTVNSIFDVNLDGNLTDRLNTTSGIVVTGDRRQPLRLTADPLSLLAPVGQDGQVGRNTFRAGSVLDLSAALIKNLHFGEQQNLSLRVDVFNFLNRANYGVPVRFLEAPGFGQATSTVTPARRVQFALKFSF